CLDQAQPPLDPVKPDIMTIQPGYHASVMALLSRHERAELNFQRRDPLLELTDILDHAVELFVHGAEHPQDQVIGLVVHQSPVERADNIPATDTVSHIHRTNTTVLPAYRAFTDRLPKLACGTPRFSDRCECTPSHPSALLWNTIVARPGRSNRVPSSWNPVLVQGAITTAMLPSPEASTCVASRSKRKSAVRGQTLSHCAFTQASRLGSTSRCVPKARMRG